MNAPKERDVLAVAKRIRAARERRGLSQSQLSKLSRIDANTLSDIEVGRRPPRFHQLLALHRGLKTEPGEILAV